MTSFGNRVSTDVIKLNKVVCVVLGCTLSSLGLACLEQEGNLDTETQIHRLEHHVKMEAETGVMYLRSLKVCQELLATT